MRWLLALATASFLGLFALTTSAVLFPRAPIGVTFDPQQGLTFLRNVGRGSIAERAGLRDGDRIISAGGLPLRRSLDARVLSLVLPAHAPFTWVVERNGQTLSIVTEPPGRRWLVTALNVVTVASLGLSLVLGVVLAWRRHDDPIALLGAWLLASIGSVVVPIGLRSIAAAWNALPGPIGVLFIPAAVSSALTPAILFTFAALVPRPLLSKRTLTLLLIPIVSVAVYMAVWLLLAVYSPSRAMNYPLPAWLEVAGPLSFPIYFAGAMLLFWTNLRRSTDANERRRARILLVGTAAGALGLVPVAIAFARDQLLSRITEGMLVTGAVLFAILPLSFAYATLRHRLFDLRIIVRLGLQYALLRGAMLALVPLAGLLLVGDLLRHGDQPVRQILFDRGWSYIVLGVAAVVTFTQRQPWMAALDRRFFREQYVAQQVLRQVVEEVGRATSLASVAEPVLAKLSAALHPRRAALLVREPQARAFAPLAVQPAQAPMPALASESAVVRIVRALGKTVVLSVDRSGLRRDLPPQDLQWLADADIELLVPVVMSESAREVLLALGPRLSDEPYSQEDLELLAAVASSLAIVDRVSSARAAESPVAVRDAAGPISGRYRLGRLIGEGGMGSVWEAHDEELDRPVAIKRLKTATPAGAPDTERFKREARAAARLSHPNIVVVHDFGVDAEQHPFLVMERLVGETLRERLHRTPRLTPVQAVALAADASAGIAAAHAQQIVHRDLKPENIFLSGDRSHPTVKILDFGIARSIAFSATSMQTTSGAIAGTLMYMAPEQLAGAHPSAAWDLWALAVICYEMLAGAHPMPLLLAGRIDPIRMHVPDAPEAWQSFFNRALSLDAAARPSSATMMAAEFARAVGA